ncbi:MAG: hypothetical protein J5873_05160 [Bacteroidales bacterium]|nr:hypothetical protein [Bacteroidales bacterium]
MKIKLLILTAFLSAGFCSCRPGQPLMDETVSFPNHAWNRFRVLSFHPELPKEDGCYDVKVRIVVSDDFAFSEVPIHTVLKSPDGQVNVMRKVVGVRKADGSHEGTVFGDSWTVEKTIYSQRKFSQKGTYTFEVQQMTQYYDLNGIEAVSCVILPTKAS